MKKINWITTAIFVAVLAALALGCNLSKTSSNNSSTTSASNDNKATNSSSSPAANSQDHSKSATPAPKPDIAGKYNITGTNPDGGSYKGTMEVITRGDVYQFRWDAGSQYDGVGVQNGNIVAVAYTTGSNGKGCGVVDYDIQGDGTLDGKWGYWGTNEMGTETAMRTGGSSLAGEYDATGKNPDGKQYKAKLTVEPAGNLYHFVWSNNSEGVGIKRGSNVAVGIGGARCGFVTYQVQSNGSLDGIWGGGGSDKTGTENAMKQ
jgi:hypothetical protein